MPSLKMTPPEGISDSISSTWFGNTGPVTSVPCECLLTNGSRTTKRSSGASHAMRTGFSAWPPKLCDIALAKLHTDESQPVEPAPVETMMPLLLWRSLRRAFPTPWLRR